MRSVPEKAIAFIKTWEGFSSKIYHCVAGYPTIGYGHVVKPSEIFIEPISEVEATALLWKDVNLCNFYLSRLCLPEVYIDLKDRQVAALLSFIFNLGSGAFQRSTLRQMLNRFEYEDAAEEFPKWVYAGGKKVRGLILRRMAERRLFTNE